MSGLAKGKIVKERINLLDIILEEYVEDQENITELWKLKQSVTFKDFFRRKNLSFWVKITER